MRTALLSLMCLFTSFTAVAESASDIVQKSDQAMRGDQSGGVVAFS